MQEISLSPGTKETTPLLKRKEPVARYAKANTREHISEPTQVHDLDSAAASSTHSRDEAASSAAGDETSPSRVGNEADLSAVGNEAAPSRAVDEAAVSKNRQAVKEAVAESISSYEGMAGVFSPTYGCGPLFGIWLCFCHVLSSFVIQFPLHVLLLPLPIATGFTGAKYMTQCPMNAKLPYAMMVVGGLGSLVLLVRLTYLLHAKYSTDELCEKWLKTASKLLEFVFLVSLITEFCFSYKYSPSFVPGDVNYCNQTFYNFVSSTNNVWITLVVVWGFLYFVTGQRCMRRNAP